MNANLTLYLPQVLLTWRQFLDVSNPARQFLDIFEKVKRKIRNFPSPENSFVWKLFFFLLKIIRDIEKNLLKGRGRSLNFMKGGEFCMAFRAFYSIFWLNYIFLENVKKLSRKVRNSPAALEMSRNCTAGLDPQVRRTCGE